MDSTRRAGNKSLTILRGGFAVTYLRTDRAEFDVSGSLRYGESQGEVIERQLRAAVKLDLIPQADWTFAISFRFDF